MEEEILIGCGYYPDEPTGTPVTCSFCGTELTLAPTSLPLLKKGGKPSCHPCLRRELAAADEIALCETKEQEKEREAMGFTVEQRRAMMLHHMAKIVNEEDDKKEQMH